MLDEKIQYLKFNDYKGKQLITDCADKYRVREYIKSCGCAEILNTLIDSWDRVEDIDWDKLPEKFVIKWNFGCGHNLIVPDKSRLDIPQAIKKLKEWYKTRDTFYLSHSELHYKGIKPKLICERLIETDDGSLPVDYKLYCFGGEPHCVMLCLGRDTDGQRPKFYFLDKDGKLLRYNKTGAAAPENFRIDLPQGYADLFKYASKITKPFPFVRCDLYLEKGKVIFGELTFTPNGGCDSNLLQEAQNALGAKVKISQTKD